MPFTPTTWSTLMRKFLAACRRLDDHWIGDLIGLVGLFAIVPLILFAAQIMGCAK